jgi:hypothetical protein
MVLKVRDIGLQGCWKHFRTEEVEVSNGDGEGMKVKGFIHS